MNGGNTTTRITNALMWKIIITPPRKRTSGEIYYRRQQMQGRVWTMAQALILLKWAMLLWVWNKATWRASESKIIPKVAPKGSNNSGKKRKMPWSQVQCSKCSFMGHGTWISGACKKHSEYLEHLQRCGKWYMCVTITNRVIKNGYLEDTNLNSRTYYR